MSSAKWHLLRLGLNVLNKQEASVRFVEELAPSDVSKFKGTLAENLG